MRERVERDVQSAEARLDERRREPVEQDAVRRQREVVDAGDRRQHADELRQVAPDERLAAREPHLVDAHLREHAHEPRDLLEAEQLFTRQPLEPFRRHAIAAAEVALVRDGHAQALDLSAPAVDERLHAAQGTTRGRARLK